MKTKIKTHHALCGLLSGLLLLAAGTAQSHASVMFSENFNSNTLGPNLGLAQGSVNVSGGMVVFPPQGTYSGVYTLDTDYQTGDFLAQITVTMAPGPLNNVVFFGLGRGLTTPDPGDNFGNPASGPVVFIRHFGNFGGNPENNLTITTNDENNGGLTPGGGMGEILNQNGVGPGFGTYTLQVQHIAGLVQFSVNNVAYGPAVDVSSYDFTGHGRIFFGGAETSSGSISFDNFSVQAVPEPGALTLWLVCIGGLVGSALVRRRRGVAAELSLSS